MVETSKNYDLEKKIQLKIDLMIREVMNYKLKFQPYWLCLVVV